MLPLLAFLAGDQILKNQQASDNYTNQIINSGRASAPSAAAQAPAEPQETGLEKLIKMLSKKKEDAADMQATDIDKKLDLGSLGKLAGPLGF